MVAVDDAQNVAELDAASQAKGVRLRVLVELNIGMGRCGALPGEPALALAQQVAAAPGLRFEGLMGYEGHTVFEVDLTERKRKTEASLKQLVDTTELLRANGIPVPIVSSGGTGTYFITGRYPGITEIEVGSYITMDDQYRSEVGIDFACALTVLASVTSVPSPDRAFIDAGLKTVTRDFGLPRLIAPAGWELTGLSEEHGHLRRIDGAALRPGDKVELVPNHGCTTINLHDEYHVIRRGVLEAVWPIAARGKVR
jgi:D-serine deaminase-like pyridoxal phosphate-dependent protein